MASASAEQGNGREAMWTERLPVGREDFFARTRQTLKAASRDRKIRKTMGGWELREDEGPYNACLDGENGVIEPKNLHFWWLNDKISVT